jgi:transposase
MKDHVLRNKTFADKKRAKKKIPKGLLSKFVKRNKATKWIAQYFKVSSRTIYRRVREYGLKGLRPKGKKPPFKKIRKIKKLKGWIPTDRYIDNLDRQYCFQNIQYPPSKYVNTYTLTCSNKKRNPTGLFTTCSVYYIALESDMYFLYAIQYRYTEEGVTYDEIHHYFSNNAIRMLQLSLEGTEIEIIDLVAFAFSFKPEEMKPVVAYTNRFSEKVKHAETRKRARKSRKRKRSHG